MESTPKQPSELTVSTRLQKGNTPQYLSYEKDTKPAIASQPGLDAIASVGGDLILFKKGKKALGIVQMSPMSGWPIVGSVIAK